MFINVRIACSVLLLRFFFTFSLQNPHNGQRLFMHAAGATTSEAMPPYEIATSRRKLVIVDEHSQPRRRPRPPALLGNISLASVQDRPLLPPSDVTAVRQSDGSVLLRWIASDDRVDHYVVQHRTVGGWLPLADRLDAGVTSFVWSTASRGVVYRFRLVGVSENLGNSFPSNVATLDVEGPLFFSISESIYQRALL